MDKPVTVSATRRATARVTSPLRLFILLLIVLFVAEAIIMFTLPLLFPTTLGPLANFADSLLLISLSAPFLWILIVQPLRTAVKTESTWAAALLDRVVDGVVIIDANCLVTSINPAAEEIFGCHAREVMGQHLNCLIPEGGENGEDLYSVMGLCHSPRECDRVRHEIVGRRKNGAPFAMDFSVSRVSLAGETAYICIVRDATERKRIEAAIIEKQRLLAELNLSLEERVAATVNELREKDRILIQQSRMAAMGELINNIAHQWRQPLNRLAMLIQRQPLFFETGKFDKEFLDSNTVDAMGQVRYLSRTIDDFANFFRPDTEQCTFPVNQVVNQTIDLVKANLTALNISSDMNLHGDPHIFGYRNEYSQVILAILFNARDALIEQKIENPQIKVASFMENDRSVVAISDNGGGIPEGIQDKIFDPYFTTKGPDVGMGIGLFMAKSIIEKGMNGRITQRNSEDGAEFRIEVAGRDNDTKVHEQAG